MNTLAALLSLAPLSALVPGSPQDVAALRAEGPAALDRLLAQYDELAPGPRKQVLERTIDAVAGQRHATYARLYWYTDLAAAVSAARSSGRPILSLRLLGRLDDELSCANSRFFRIVLYADRELASFLRENFVLHWSSERPVPRVTIDFGDGRKIETTLAGNSAHYVLDANGRPLDVLPGLYDARAFRRELEALLPLARASSGLDAAERARRVKEYHIERQRESARFWAESGPPARFDLSTGTEIEAAERITMTKAPVEMPLVAAAGLGGARSDAFGTRSRSNPLATPGTLWVKRLPEARLDDRSRALVTELGPTNGSFEAEPLLGAELERPIRNLEALAAADTERNELALHGRIHEWFVRDRALPDFTALNERVYRELFLTDANDAWLGVLNPNVFNALPNDGIVR